MADDPTSNGSAPPDDDDKEFVADLDALVPETKPFVFGGVTYQVVQFIDVSIDNELRVLRIEEQIKAAGSMEEIITLHRNQARLLAPTVPEDVLGRMNLRQLKYLGQVSIGTARPTRAARTERAASSSTLPAPPVSTGGVTTP